MIPFEIITFLGSSLISGFLKGWSKKIEVEKERNAMMIAALSTKANIFKQAREHGLKDREFAWLRRTVTLLCILAIVVLPIVLPLVSSMLGDPINITHGWTEWKPGFLFLTEGKETFMWREVTGPAITPLHTNLVSAIAGFLFGSDTVGKKK